MDQPLRRRDLLLLPLALACPPLLSALPDTQTTRARYRIDVSIAPFGFTIFSRKEVGFGSARLDLQNLDGQQTISFEFGAASLPERTRGIFQIGYFEESLTQTRSALLSSNYFGFISSTPETAPNLASLNLVASANDKPQLCCAVEGRLAQGQASFTKTYEAPLPAGLNFSSLRQLMRRRLANICETSCLHGSRTAIPVKTFLSVLAEAALGPSTHLRSAYQYGDSVLDFEANRQNFSGKIVVDAEVRGKSRHCFSFTSADSKVPSLPLKISYTPKSWLRLSLEAVPDPLPPKETL